MAKNSKIVCAGCLTGSIVLPMTLLIMDSLGFFFSSACLYAIFVVCIGAMLSACILFVKNKSPRLGVGFGLTITLCVLSFIACATMFLFRNEFLLFLILNIACVLMALFLLIRFVRSRVIRVIALLLCVLMLLPVIAIAPFRMIFKDFGKITIVNEIPSPDQRYVAHLIDNDQGALGGSTQVKVIGKPVIDLGPFRIERPEKTIYTGEWGEFEDMEIHWKDETTLVIDGRKYQID
ncbi:MAG: hypothetical protein E7322_07870 [Clostridiales bacterium]|nr:hypothetical protein [Clostridiales bacterium]